MFVNVKKCKGISEETMADIEDFMKHLLPVPLSSFEEF